MSDDTEEPFLVEGIKRYAQALETIQAFQTMLEDRLRKVAEAYACDLFSPKKVPIDTGASEGSWGRAIWATQEGILSGRRGSVWLELGMWWRDGEVAYYCGFVDVANKAIDFPIVVIIRESKFLSGRRSHGYSWSPRKRRWGSSASSRSSWTSSSNLFASSSLHARSFLLVARVGVNRRDHWRSSTTTRCPMIVP